jgi:hypothetical protein
MHRAWNLAILGKLRAIPKVHEEGPAFLLLRYLGRIEVFNPIFCI